MGWIRRLRNSVLGSNVDERFDDEARFHLETRWPREESAGGETLVDRPARRACSREQIMSRSAVAALVLALACGCTACRRSPAGPDQAPLDIGRWSGEGACLSVTAAGCDLTVGCGRGQFPRPIIHADGTFDVDGTYRVEAGPVSVEPAPPAHFAGSVSGIGLVLTVVPVSLPKASYGFVRSDSRPCSILCLSVGTTSRLRGEPPPAPQRRSTRHDSQPWRPVLVAARKLGD